MATSIILPQGGAWGDPAGFHNTAYNSGLIGSWRFGRPPGATDTQSYQWCARNKAINGGRGIAHSNVVGTPTVQDDYWTFQNGLFVRNGDPAPPSPPNPLPSFLMTDIPEPPIWSAYVVMRTMSVPGSPPAGAFGWYSSNDGNGNVVVIYSTNQYRLVGFENPAVPNSISAAVVFTNGTYSTWRVAYFDAADTELKAQNLTGDSIVNEPPVTVPVSGLIRSKRPLIIGGCYEGFTILTIDIHSLRIYTGVLHDAPTKAGILAEIRDGFVGTSITA